MELHYVERTLSSQDAPEVLVGATMLDNKPLWAVLKNESVTQPMLFRNKDYATWCLNIAMNKDRYAAEYTAVRYEVKTLIFPD